MYALVLPLHPHPTPPFPLCSLRQVSEDLARKKVRDPSDFEWLKQCRCAWREDRDTVVVSVCDIDFEYSYEYLGEAAWLAGGVCCPQFLINTSTWVRHHPQLGVALLVLAVLGMLREVRSAGQGGWSSAACAHFTPQAAAEASAACSAVNGFH